MKSKEAIKLLSNRYIVVSMHVNKDYCVKNNDAIDTAIEALKKQVPMKPTVQNEDEYVVNYKCPKCGCRFVSKIDGEFVAGMHYKYCYICGQRIDWEGVE